MRSLLLLLGLALGVWPLTAAELTAEEQAIAPRLTFIRVFAPAGHAEQWKGKLPLLPIDGEEFERLVKAARAAPERARSSNAVRLVRARYEAALDGTDVLAGVARFEIATPHQGAALVTLAPCGLALDHARWEDAAPNGDNDSLAASLGLSPSGKLAALVERPGVLTADWSLAGQRDATGATAFTLEMPRVGVNTLWLDLPDGLVPSVEPGVVVGEAQRDRGVQRWHIELGGGGVTVLRLSARESNGEQRRLALLRQASRYELSPAGLDMTAELRIDVHNEPLRSLKLELDAGLQLVSAAVSSPLGETAVPWLSPASAADGARNVTLEFPEPLLGTDRTLKLRALAALVTDRAWRLPGIRPQGLFWQEGSATLLVPAPLSLDQFLTEGCRQSKAGRLAAPLSGESLEVQFFSPEARIEARLSQRHASIVLDRGTSVVLTEGGTTGAFVGEFRVDGGERYQLEADVDENWIIDSVNTEPPNRLASWNVEAAGPTQRTLSVLLMQALTRDRPVKLRIAGRMAAAPSERRLRAGDFRMGNFSGAVIGRDLLALATPSHRLQLSGSDDSDRLDPTKLSPSERRLFTDTPTGPIFDLAAGDGGWTAVLDRQPARYTVDIRVEARVSAGSLIESYTLGCVPDDAALERVVVHFTRARKERPRWHLLGEPRAGLTATRWSADQESAAGFDAGGETWEVALVAPRTAAFELHATRATPFTAQSPISLAALPEADAQQGTVVLLADDDVPSIDVKARLQPVTLPPVGAAEYSTVRAMYHYDAASELGAIDTAAITVAPAPSLSVPSAAFVWESRLSSRFEASGRGVHLATYRIENTGARHCRLSLPSRASLAGLWVDGVAAPYGEIAGSIAVELPPGRRFPWLAVEYVLNGESWGLVGNCTAAWPQLDLVELSRYWRFSLPPGYEWIAAADDAAKPLERSWSQRWFGPLGRPSNQRPFEATNGDDWRKLIRSDPPGSAAEPYSSTPAPRAFADAGGQPWGEDFPSGLELVDRPGWSIYEPTVTSNAPLEVRVVRGATLWAVGWGLLAFMFAAGRWWLRHNPILSSIMVGMVAAVSLMVPDALSPLAAGAFVGALAAGVLNLLPERRPHIQRQADDTRSSARPAGGALALLVLAVGMSQACREGMVRAADPAPAAKARPGDKLFQVFVPSDDQGKPNGDRYQVPSALLAELRRRATAAANTPAGWLLQNASYRVALDRGAKESQLEVVDFKVRFELRVFQPNTRVRIPLGQEGVSLVLDSVLLDGRPFPLEWDSDGQSLECDVRDSGTCQLEFKIRPVLRTAGETSGFDITIPPLATLTLELTAPKTSGVEVLSAVGRTRPSKDGERWTAQLGPAGRLAVRWPQRGGAVGPVVDVDEFLWLTVQPGAVVLNAVHKYKVSGGEVRRLEFIADPKLRLVPLEGPESPVADDVSTPSHDDAPNSPNVVQLALKQPLGDVPLRTTWLLTRTSGVGNIRLPLLRPKGARSVRRWLAVSVHQALEFKVRDDETLETVDPKEFTSGWGNSEGPPLLAYRLPDGDVSWNLATSTRDPLTTVKQTMLIGFQRGSAALRFDAELLTTAGHCFQHRLIAPPALQIDSISLTSEGAERAARWIRDESGGITLFLSDRVTGPQRLSLRGRLPTPLIGSLPLPNLSIQGGESLSRTVQIYRRPDVKVVIDDRAGFDPVSEQSRDAGGSRLGRLVAALAATAESASAVVSVSPNEPRLEATQVASLRYQDEAWQVEVECLLNVVNGLVDSLRFEIPAQWTGPFEVTPPASVDVDAATNASRRRLTIRPRAALEGRHRIALSGRFATGDQITAPDISLEAEAVERFAVLPTRIGAQQVAWKTSRWTPAKLPDFMAESLPRVEAYETFRAAGEDPQAVLTPIKPSAEVRRLQWADIRLAWHTDGTCRSAAAFDLDPAGLLSCPLHIPAGWRLVAALVGGVSVTPVPEGDFQWRLPLSSSRLPQRIVILATGALPQTPADGAAVAIEVPRLGELVAENTLWTLSAPAGWVTLALADDTRPIDPLAAELYRLRNVDGLLDLKDELIHTLPPDELANWYRPWARRLLIGRAAVRQRQRQGKTPLGELGSEADKILGDDPAIHAERLGVTSVLESIDSATLVADQPGNLWDQFSSGQFSSDQFSAGQFSAGEVSAGEVSAGQGTTTRYLAARHSPRPRFSLVRSGGDDFTERVTAAGGIVLSALALAVVLAIRTPRDTWRQWPQVWGVAAGVAWWLWLTPSVLGWVIMAISLWSSWRPPWRPVREPRPAMKANTGEH